MKVSKLWVLYKTMSKSIGLEQGCISHGEMIRLELERDQYRTETWRRASFLGLRHVELYCSKFGCPHKVACTQSLDAFFWNKVVPFTWARIHCQMCASWCLHWLVEALSELQVDGLQSLVYVFLFLYKEMNYSTINDIL